MTDPLEHAGGKPDEDAHVDLPAHIDALAFLAETRFEGALIEPPADEREHDAFLDLMTPDDDAEGIDVDALTGRRRLEGYLLDELAERFISSGALVAASFVTGLREAGELGDVEELTASLAYTDEEFEQDRAQYLDSQPASHAPYIRGITREHVLEQLIVRELKRRLHAARGG